MRAPHDGIRRRPGTTPAPRSSARRSAATRTNGFVEIGGGPVSDTASKLHRGGCSAHCGRPVWLRASGTPADVADTRSWRVIESSVDTGSLTGIPDLTLELADVELKFNTASDSANAAAVVPVIDWTSQVQPAGASTPATPLTITKADGSTLRVRASDFKAAARTAGPEGPPARSSSSSTGVSCRASPAEEHGELARTPLRGGRPLLGGPGLGGPPRPPCRAGLPVAASAWFRPLAARVVRGGEHALDAGERRVTRGCGHGLRQALVANAHRPIEATHAPVFVEPRAARVNGFESASATLARPLGADDSHQRHRAPDRRDRRAPGPGRGLSRLSLIGTAISVLAVAGVVWWALRQEPPRFPDSAGEWGALAGAIALYAVATLVRGERWQSLLRAEGARPSRADCTA